MNFLIRHAVVAGTGMDKDSGNRPTTTLPDSVGSSILPGCNGLISQQS